MVDRAAKQASIDGYISAFPPPLQKILRRIRATIAAAAPDAQEFISYRMPAFAQQGVLLYFAAFKSHIGVYPPVVGDARLEKALSAYSGPKGNLRFPLDQPIPYGLIRRIAILRVKQNLAKAGAAGWKRRAIRKAPPNKRLQPTARVSSLERSTERARRG